MQLRFRCTFCGSVIPWEIPPADLALGEAESAVPGRLYPYEKCSCGYGRFVEAESPSAPPAAGGPLTGDGRVGISTSTREKVDRARYERLPIEKVHPNPKQPRKFFDGEALRGLADSIARIGLLEDILVRPDGAEYEIVLGERRWRASRIACLATIPAKVAALDDGEARLISLTENVHREDLTGVEEAFSFKAYVDEGRRLTEVGAAFGGMEQRVAERLKMLNSHYYVRFQEERIERLQGIVETLRERLRQSANGRYEARIVELERLEAHLADGFDVAAVLPDGRVAVRRRVD